MKGLITQLESSKVPDGRCVYIIRHGQTALNVADKIRGWSNIPLDDVGIQQAIDLGQELASQGIELDGLISSDLLRSVQTSLEISKETGIPLLGTTRALRPLDVGTYTGKDGKMVHKIIAEHAQHKPDEEVGGGESFNIFKYRMLSGIIGILNSHRGLKLGLVSHSRGERLLNAWVAGGCDSDFDIDMDVFLERGEGTATAQELIIDSPLVLS